MSQVNLSFRRHSSRRAEAAELPEYPTRGPDRFIRLTGHRIGLHEIVLLYEEGYSPEMLLGQFPTLSLALIHNVLAFYLDNQEEVGRYAADQIEATERQRADAPRSPHHGPAPGAKSRIKMTIKIRNRSRSKRKI